MLQLLLSSAKHRDIVLRDVRLNFEQIYLPKFTNSKSIVDSELLYKKEPLEISF
jgi:hypothetical protein